MDAERKRQLKALGKAEVERRSAELRATLDEANLAPPGSDAWAARYRTGTERERWLRATLPTLRRGELESLFVVLEEDGAGWVPRLGGYVLCKACGSAAPSALPRRWFYWTSCECGNIRWRCLLGWRKAFVRDPQSLVPVKLIGRG